MSDFEIDQTVKVYRSPDGLFVPLRGKPADGGWEVRNRLFWAYTSEGPELAKRCTGCNQVKLGRDFYHAEKGAGNLAGRCKGCTGKPAEVEEEAAQEVLEVDLTEVFERIDQLDAHAQAITAALISLGDKVDTLIKALGGVE